MTFFATWSIVLGNEVPKTFWIKFLLSKDSICAAVCTAVFKISYGFLSGTESNTDLKFCTIPFASRPNPDDVDVVIQNENRTRLGRLIQKFENASGVKVRTYENPNNVPNNNNRIRNYNRVENNSNNNIIRNNNNSRPTRTYTPPPTRSSSPPVINRGSSSGRSSGGAVISRGSSGGRNNID